MKLKTLEQLYLLNPFNDYKASLIEHRFVYIKDLEQYALITHSGILFDDYKFIDDRDISDSEIEDLDIAIQFIEKNLGPVIKIIQEELMVDTEKIQSRPTKEEILATNKYFKSYKRDQLKKLFWSEKFNKYYLATEKGIMFEDGVFYSREECLKLQADMPSDKTLQAIHAAKAEFGWDQAQIID